MIPRAFSLSFALLELAYAAPVMPKPGPAEKPASYVYEMVVIPIPELTNDSQKPVKILEGKADWEIVSVVATTAPVKAPNGTDDKQTARQILIYTLRKPK